MPSLYHREINILSRVFKGFLRTCSFNDVNGRRGGGGLMRQSPILLMMQVRAWMETMVIYSLNLTG